MVGKFTYDALAVLRASASQAVGSENGDAVQLGPTKIIKANIVVTVVGSSGTLDAKLQGSTTESGTYYDIPGGQFLDPTDGAIIDAVGKYEIFVQTDFDWIRTVGTVATAAITWQCFLSEAN